MYAARPRPSSATNAVTSVGLRPHTDDAPPPAIEQPLEGAVEFGLWSWTGGEVGRRRGAVLGVKGGVGGVGSASVEAERTREWRRTRT